jgi:hypothetical protein
MDPKVAVTEVAVPTTDPALRFDAKYGAEFGFDYGYGYGYVVVSTDGRQGRPSAPRDPA